MFDNDILRRWSNYGDPSGVEIIKSETNKDGDIIILIDYKGRRSKIFMEKVEYKKRLRQKNKYTFG